MGFVIVEFPERREVFVDEASQGDNRDDHDEYRILRVGDGLRSFRLGGPRDCAPPTQTVEVADTTSIDPLRVVFSKIPSP